MQPRKIAGPNQKKDFFVRTIDRIRTPSSSRKGWFWLLITGLLIGVVIFYGIRIFTLKNFASQSKSQIYQQLEEAHRALAHFDPAGAQQPLTKIKEELDFVQREASKFGLLKLTSIGGWVSDRISAIPGALQQLLGISGTAVHIAEDSAYLKEHAAELMMTGRGEELLAKIAEFKAKLLLLTDYIDTLESSSITDVELSTRLAKLRGELTGSTAAIDAVVELIGSNEPTHVLVAFLNQTEIRPGGGFIGSYGDITFTRGSITNIDIRDIYDPDGQLDQKLIPPEPLQTITKDWEARDANWFFDYPTSAKLFTRFLEESKIYSEKNIRFKGVIAVNTTVVTDLMRLVGPIELPEYKLTITPENLLGEVQREVESGADKKVNKPKRILTILAPKILHEVTTFDDTEKEAFIRLLSEHARYRNIMAYATIPRLQEFISRQGLGGDILTGSSGVLNEYLAVVNANIGGGKSDAVVSQKIDFKASINELGEITNTVTITRKHNGAKAKEWWYRAANKNFLQLYTPLGSRLTAAEGRSRWPTLPKYDYRGYATSPDLAAIAETGRYNSELGVDRAIVSGKTVFSAWVNTPTGNSATASFTYSNPRLLPPASGIPYEFIFEKQSGASTTLSLSISAPPKYKWKEINKGAIEYTTDNPPGRMRIRQTLVPIE